jgi:ribonucleoside-diphosphate reductase beta chain
MASTDAPMHIDTDAQSFRYYRHAVEKHWDPHDIDLDTDREEIAGLDDEQFDGLKRALALFGAGEDAVAEDLAPLAVVLDDFEDQLFITTQLYEEAKHADFFDRYWREVIHAAEDDRGQAHSSPADERWFNDEYDELFEHNERAMARLLDDDTPENRAKAYSHYHMTVEGILAQTGYYGLTRQFDGETYPEAPTCPDWLPVLPKSGAMRAATSASGWRNSKNSSRPSASNPRSSKEPSATSFRWYRRHSRVISTSAPVMTASHPPNSPSTRRTNTASA